MRYHPSNIIGDAGEHLVAARIIKWFGYPCRLTNIDIGIDAEIELIDSNYKSTGEFVKCQIKTTNSKNFHQYIDGEHLNYWNRVKLPVVVFLVHLESEEIYWKYISNIVEHIEAGKQYRIDFSPEDLLAAGDKQRFDEISLIPIKRQIEEIYDEAYTVVISDNELLESDGYDLTTFEDFVLHSNKILHDFKKADRLIDKTPSLNYIETAYHQKLLVVNQYLARIAEEKADAKLDHGDDYFDHLESDRFTWD